MKGVKESSKLAISQGRKSSVSEAGSPSGKFSDTTAPSAAKCVLGKTGGQSPFPLRCYTTSGHLDIPVIL